MIGNAPPGTLPVAPGMIGLGEFLHEFSHLRSWLDIEFASENEPEAFVFTHCLGGVPLGEMHSDHRAVGALA